MTDSFDDELSRHLASLDTDIRGARMPGAAAARRRAAQRTRHQITGTILTGMAAAAIGVVVLGDPVVTTTPDPAPPAGTSEPSPSESPTATETDLRDALLRAEDVAGTAGGTWTASGEQNEPVRCTPGQSLASISSQRGHEHVEFVDRENTRVSQDLFRVAEGDAAEALGALRAQVLACVPPRQSGELPRLTDDLDLLEVGDEAWMTRYYMDPEDQDALAATIGIVRHEDVLSITVRTEPTSNTVGDVDAATPAAAAERMCRVLFDTDCVGEPNLDDRTGTTPGPDDTATEDPPEQSGEPGQSEEPDPPEQPGESPAAELLQLADDPYLTPGDLNPVGASRFEFTRAEDLPEGDPFAFRCLSDLTARGADPLLSAHWFSDLDASVVEFVLRMPDVDAAMRTITDHTILPDQCGEVVETHKQTVGEPAVIDVEGAAEALAWTVRTEPLPEDPGSSTSFHGVAMARQANVVVVVSFGAMDDATEGGWNEYAARTLAVALDRAVR